MAKSINQIESTSNLFNDDLLIVEQPGGTRTVTLQNLVDLYISRTINLSGYATINNLMNLLSEKSDIGHLHNDVYNTKSEITYMLELKASKEDVYTKLQVNNLIKSLDRRVEELEDAVVALNSKISELENALNRKAICGTFNAGEVLAGEGVTNSFLSENFRNAFGDDIDE